MINNFEKIYQETSFNNYEYFYKLQESLKLDFIVCLLELNNINDNIKKNFIELQQLKKIFKQSNDFSALNIFYEKNIEDLENFSKLIFLESILNDILRRARKSILNDSIIDQKYSLSDILKICFDKNILASEIQQLINEKLVANFSLTYHPTNPFNLDYTILGNRFDELISFGEKIDFKELHKTIKQMISCDLKPHKKSPLDEMIETELALKNIKKANKKIVKEWQLLLDNSPYKNQIIIPKKICNIAVWSHGGDGDGNPQITANVLDIGLQRIKKLKLAVKIDIRHDANDILQCFNDIFHNYVDISAVNFKTLENIFQNNKLLKEIYDKIVKDNKINNDLLLRFLLINKNYKYIDKFIISNFCKIENYLMVMILLKLTNSHQKIPKINIVSLSESLEDLKNIAKIHEQLLSLKIYRDHLKKTKKIIAMIAKSDTVRVAGSAVKFYQDLASGELLFLKKIAQLKYNFKLAVHIFSGGGNSMQRGGGKFFEIPIVHSINGWQEYFNKNEEIDNIDASFTTVQGQQQQILFSCEKYAKNSLKNFALINLASDLLLKKILKYPSFQINNDYKIYQIFSEISVKNYQHKYYENNLINRLFYQANHLGVALANLSSRPAKRPNSIQQNANLNISSPFNYQQFKGDIFQYNLFNTRAITLDRTVAHSGTFILSFLGIVEGLEEIIGKFGLKKIQEMAINSQKFHEFLVNQIMALYLVDIDYAWQMFFGKNRADEIMIEESAKKFFENFTKNLPIIEQQFISLSYIDYYIFKLAKIIAKIFFDDDNFLNYKNFNINFLLQKYLPNFASQLDYRKSQAIFTRFCQSKLINKYNNYYDKSINDLDIQIIYNLYVANNPAFNSPIQTNYNFKLEKLIS